MSYSALKDEFENDFDLSSHLEISKDNLQQHYKEHYAPSESTPSLSQPSQPSLSATSNASPQKNFIARFNRKPRTSTDELLEFWSLPQEDFETCDPLHWWYGRRTQFPNLYRLVRDIFSIPGG
jgi:hAT family C-terminal dimerisation region